MIIFVFLAYFGIAAMREVSGHGRLMEPPSRNAMWRYGYPNPVNYNDNELFCGGFIVHYQKNKGKCGVCGDNYENPAPRDHEAGGLFGNGIIVRRYVMGQEITITAELTTNHKGWMELKLCPNNNAKQIVTAECFERYPLQVVPGSGPVTDVPGQGHRFIIPEESQKKETFTWMVKLPDFLTCSQCIIQWTYFAGNTWGECQDGSESVGCGNQETFVNCADIEIYSNTANVPSDLVENPWALYYESIDREATDSHPYGLRPLVVMSQLCIPTDRYANMTGMEAWCRQNCLKYPPYCHPDFCHCVSECVAVGSFSEIVDADVFCHQNCLKYPSNCPSDRCRCF